MSGFDAFVYKLGIIVGVVFLVVCILGLIGDIRRRRRLSRETNLGNVPNNSNNLTEIMTSEPLAWTFPITVNKLGRITSIDEFQLFFLESSSIQANLDLPTSKSKAYFEIKILALESDSQIFVGLSKRDDTKDVVLGAVDNSIAIDSKFGRILISGKPLEWINAKPFAKGDVIGCLVIREYPPQAIFTHNGEEIGPAPLPSSLLNLTPTIYCNGQAQIQFNFGNFEFLYSKANLFRYGLVSTSTLVELPPAYTEDFQGLPNTSSRIIDESSPRYPN